MREIYERSKIAETHESRLQQVAKEIFGKKKDINFVIIDDEIPYIAGLAETERFIPAVLNDVAKMAGLKIYIENNSPKEFIKALRFSRAVVVREVGAVFIGKTQFDAELVAEVTEKGAKAYVEATILGGARRISRFDALRMRR
ncbi:MAG: hypothetical protein FWD49_00675 [Firmicutes bacterium]|nr:hypothetical protein [Bacillota bacterium]